MKFCWRIQNNEDIIFLKIIIEKQLFENFIDKLSNYYGMSNVIHNISNITKTPFL